MGFEFNTRLYLVRIMIISFYDNLNIKLVKYAFMYIPINPIPILNNIPRYLTSFTKLKIQFCNFFYVWHTVEVDWYS